MNLAVGQNTAEKLDSFMTNKPLPVLLAIAAIVVPLAVSIVETAIPVRWGTVWWIAWVSQIVPHAIRSTLIWMIACFITMRHGSTNWSTRTFPIAIVLLLIAGHVIVPAVAALISRPFGSISNGGLATAGEATSLVLVLANLLVFSQLLNVSLRRVNCTSEIPQQRITVRTILIATTSVAIFLALQNWTRTYQVTFISDSATSTLIIYFIMFVCNASAFFGFIWLWMATKRRWLGLVGMVIWPVLPLGQLASLFSSETWKTMPGVAMALFQFTLTCDLVVLVGTLMTIPIFRLFGYQFKINSQQASHNMTSDSPQPQLRTTLAVNSPLA